MSAASSLSAASSSLSTLPPRALYRSLLRELRISPATATAHSSSPSSSASSSSSATKTRRPVILATEGFRRQALVEYVREGFRNTGGWGKEREMRNLNVYLQSNRVHKSLLLRYNPLHDQTEAERIRATARRVGLDVPKEYQPSSTPSAKEDKMQAAREYEEIVKGKRGPLPPPELESGVGGL